MNVFGSSKQHEVYPSFSDVSRIILQFTSLSHVWFIKAVITKHLSFDKDQAI